MPNDSKLEESFNLPVSANTSGVEILPPSEPIPLKATVVHTNEDLKKDIDFARKNMRDLIESSMDSFEVIKDVAEQGQTAKGFEVLGLMIRSITEANKELVGLHRNLPQEQASEEQKRPDVVNNNLFVGTTAELQALLKKSRNTSG